MCRWVYEDEEHIGVVAHDKEHMFMDCLSYTWASEYGNNDIFGGIAHRIMSDVEEHEGLESSIEAS